MADDFYTQAARSRAEAIEMQIAASRADLLVHRQNGSLQEAGETVQQIANLEAERANLTTLYNNYVASQQPRQPEVLTEEERNARPWHKIRTMAWPSPVPRNTAAASIGMTDTSVPAGRKLSGAAAVGSEPCTAMMSGTCAPR